MSAGTVCSVWYLRGALLTFQNSVNNKHLHVPFGQEHEAVQVDFWLGGYCHASHVKELKITPYNANLV